MAIDFQKMKPEDIEAFQKVLTICPCCKEPGPFKVTGAKASFGGYAPKKVPPKNTTFKWNVKCESCGYRDQVWGATPAIAGGKMEKHFQERLVSRLRS